MTFPDIKSEKKVISISGSLDCDYNSLLKDSIKAIDKGRNNAALRLNVAAATTYWELGHIMAERKLESEHGASVVRRLSSDLKKRYPSMGLSPRNLWYMKRYFDRFSSSDIKVQRAVALLPWGHITLLLDNHLNDDEVTYYSEESSSKHWTRDFLLNAIKLKIFDKRHVIDNNFSSVLPPANAKEALEIFKESYNFGFLDASGPLKELELERRLIEKVKSFLLEMGHGFTFIGNQYVLELNQKEYKVDLLLYHRKLRCLVAIDLKIGEFQPEFIGKMNFYLSLLDDQEKEADENPSIGIILCAEKDSMKVELSLRHIGKPIGVADYNLIIPQKQLERVVRDEIDDYIKGQNEKLELDGNHC